MLLAQLTDTITAGDLVHRARRTRQQRQSVFRVVPVVRFVCVRSHDRRDKVELPTVINYFARNPRDVNRHIRRGTA